MSVCFAFDFWAYGFQLELLEIFVRVASDFVPAVDVKTLVVRETSNGLLAYEHCKQNVDIETRAARPFSSVDDLLSTQK